MPLARQISLPDGRQLSFDDVGDPTGVPVLFIHGSPDSRRSRHPDDSLAAALGVRLVSVDRPGFGLSSPHRTGTLSTFAGDVIALADELEVGSWHPFGWSAGGPFAVAVAACHPERVRRVAMAAGLVPFEAYSCPGILDDADAGRHMVAEMGAELGPAGLAEMAAPMLAPFPCDLALATEHVTENADAVRRAELESVPGSTRVLAEGLVDAVSDGLDGLIRDLELQVESPDLSWDAVTSPVDLWYGDRDTTAPVAFGRWWADRLLHGHLRVEPGAGHLVAMTRWTAILEQLTTHR